MKKTFKLAELDCANCAAKMERGIGKIEGVSSVSINFMAQRLTIEADDVRFDDIMTEAAKVCRRIEPDCSIVM